MKKVWFAIITTSMFLFSNLIYARSNYDGPDSEGWSEILGNIGSAIKELFAFLF